MYKPRCRPCSRVSLLSASYAPFYVTASLWENGVRSPLPPPARGSPAPPGRGRVTKAKPNSRHFACGLERGLHPPSAQCPFYKSSLRLNRERRGPGSRWGLMGARGAGEERREGSGARPRTPAGGLTQRLVLWGTHPGVLLAAGIALSYVGSSLISKRGVNFPHEAERTKSRTEERGGGGEWEV